jgi:hypothetical protein
MIEVYFSNTKGGDLAQIASLTGLTSADDLNFHFLVCNSLGDIDGRIQPTEKWLNQWSALPAAGWYGTSKTIRVCVVGEKTDGASDYQTGRTEELVENLARSFNVPAANIQYPAGWKL